MQQVCPRRKRGRQLRCTLHWQNPTWFSDISERDTDPARNVRARRQLVSANLCHSFRVAALACIFKQSVHPAEALSSALENMMEFHSGCCRVLHDDACLHLARHLEILVDGEGDRRLVEGGVKPQS